MFYNGFERLGATSMPFLTAIGTSKSDIIVEELGIEDDTIVEVGI